jgi:hypothetical protein
MNESAALMIEVHPRHGKTRRLAGIDNLSEPVPFSGSLRNAKPACPPTPEAFRRENRDRRDSLAEREGFEPSVPVTQYARLAIWCLRPLGHLSAG